MKLTLSSDRLADVKRIAMSREPILICTRDGECLTRAVISNIDFQTDGWRDVSEVNVEIIAIREVPPSLIANLHTVK